MRVPGFDFHLAPNSSFLLMQAMETAAITQIVGLLEPRWKTRMVMLAQNSNPGQLWALPAFDE